MEKFQIKVERPKPDPVDELIAVLKRILQYCLCCVTCSCYPGPDSSSSRSSSFNGDSEYSSILLDNERVAVQNLLQYLENGKSFFFNVHVNFYPIFFLYFPSWLLGISSDTVSVFFFFFFQQFNSVSKMYTYCRCQILYPGMFDSTVSVETLKLILMSRSPVLHNLYTTTKYETVHVDKTLKQKGRYLSYRSFIIIIIIITCTFGIALLVK